jgi:hypothetical protein
VDASDEAQIICTHSRPRACVRPRTPTKVIYGQLGSATSGWKGRRNGLTGASSALPLPQSNEGGGACHTGKHFHRNCTRIRPARRRAGRLGLPCMQPWWEGPPTCGLRASRPVNMPTLSFGMTRSTNILSSCLLFRNVGSTQTFQFEDRANATPMEAVHDPRARLRRMHEVLLEGRPATEMRVSAARQLRCCMRLVQRVWGGRYLAGPASGRARERAPARGSACARSRGSTFCPASCPPYRRERTRERALACRSRTLESLLHAAPTGRRQCQRLQEPLGMRAQCSPAVCHPALHMPRARTHVRQSAHTHERQRARTHASVTMNHLSLSARPHALTTVVFDDDGEDLRVSAV